jgi:predicted ATPase
MLGIKAEDSLPYLMNLLGHAAEGVDMDKIAGETLGIHTRDAVIAMLRERCRVSPTVLIVEDLQWADTATLALLTRVVEGEEDLPLFTITTARTGHQPPWSGKQGTADLVLTRLTAGGTEALLQNRLDGQSPPDGLARLVAEKSEGNPLFAEEIIAYLQNTGALSGEGEGLTFDAGQSGAGPCPSPLKVCSWTGLTGWKAGHGRCWRPPPLPARGLAPNSWRAPRDWVTKPRSISKPWWNRI